MNCGWETRKQQMTSVYTYEEEGRQIGGLVDQKQKAYGDAFGKAGEVLKILYPNGVQPNQYTDLLTITRILDKLFRIANNPNETEEPYKDIAGYGLLGHSHSKRNK